MNKDLFEFYENEKIKIEREIQDLNEVGKKSPRRVNRLVEIDYILEGLELEASKAIQELRKENADLRYRLNVEGIDLGEW